MVEQYRKLVERYRERKASAEELEVFFYLLKTGKLDSVLVEDVNEQLGINRGKVIRWRRWVGAAAAVLVVALTTWFFLNHEDTKARRDTKELIADVKAPDSTKATITLADGKVIVPEIKNGKVEDRFLAAARNDNHILNNPRGSQVVSLTLSDGTIVWLNSESSLKYPTSFDGIERKVEITGEAYFECKKPGFKVVANGVVIEDLGTEFNVNSYDVVKTTLIKGKLQILRQAQDDKPLVLKPGEQAIGDGQLAKGTIDLEEVLAWKNGKFVFSDATVDEVMKQLERWYDVHVVYEGMKPTVHFVGDISRQENVSQVLKMLAETNAIKYKIENRKIMITK